MSIIILITNWCDVGRRPAVQRGEDVGTRKPACRAIRQPSSLPIQWLRDKLNFYIFSWEGVVYVRGGGRAKIIDLTCRRLYQARHNMTGPGQLCHDETRRERVTQFGPGCFHRICYDLSCFKNNLVRVFLTELAIIHSVRLKRGRVGNFWSDRHQQQAAWGSAFCVHVAHGNAEEKKHARELNNTV